MNEIYNTENNLDITKNTIFLAGCTSRINTSDSWRKDAVKLLKEKGFNGNVIIPEPRDNKVNFKDFDKNSQIEWERKYLSIANIIIFWIPRTKDLLGLTSNIEFGEYYKTNKVVLGYPEKIYLSKFRICF